MPLFEAALTLVNFGGTVHHLKTATILHALQNYGDYFQKVNFRITTAIMYNINLSSSVQGQKMQLMHNSS